MHCIRKKTHTFEMKTQIVTLLVISLVHSSSAQARYYAMYKMFSAQDRVCGGSFQNVYNSDLNEARIAGNDNSISSATCYKNVLGQYVSTSCDSSTGVQSFSTYSSPGCPGFPNQIYTMPPSNDCLSSNNPPLIYMGCTSDENSAISKGYQDVNKAFTTVLVRKVACWVSLCHYL